MFKCPEPAGILRVTLVEARDLMRMDVSLFGRKGKSDPYVKMSVGAKQHQSRTVKNTVEPGWDETWEVALEVSPSWPTWPGRDSSYVFDIFIMPTRLLDKFLLSL